MNSISVCVPVLKRYDLLRGMLLSLKAGTVVPSRVAIIDNGKDAAKLCAAIDGTLEKDTTYFDILVPTKPMGVAESWNWFIENVPEERVITNDDIVFAPESIEKLVACPHALAWTKEGGYSCFLIRDECVEKVGMFDEAISPGYGYYEDEDYAQRLDGRGTREPACTRGHVETGLTHLKSQTLEARTRAELNEHHRLFRIAQGNYVRKWHLEETFK